MDLFLKKCRILFLTQNVWLSVTVLSVHTADFVFLGELFERQYIECSSSSIWLSEQNTRKQYLPVIYYF